MELPFLRGTWGGWETGNKQENKNNSMLCQVYGDVKKTRQGRGTEGLRRLRCSSSWLERSVGFCQAGLRKASGKVQKPERSHRWVVWFRELRSVWLGYSRGEDERNGVMVGDWDEEARGCGVWKDALLSWQTDQQNWCLSSLLYFLLSSWRTKRNLVWLLAQGASWNSVRKYFMQFFCMFLGGFSPPATNQ